MGFRQGQTFGQSALELNQLTHRWDPAEGMGQLNVLLLVMEGTGGV